jgi:hypothetical protein
VTLIERLEAVVARLETREAELVDQERLIFHGWLPVLRDDGQVKLHGFSNGPVFLGTHTSDDICAVVTVEAMKSLEGTAWA